MVLCFELETAPRPVTLIRIELLGLVHWSLGSGPRTSVTGFWVGNRVLANVGKFLGAGFSDSGYRRGTVLVGGGE